MAEECKEHTTEVSTFKLWLIPILIVLVAILSVHFGYQIGYNDGIRWSTNQIYGDRSD